MSGATRPSRRRGDERGDTLIEILVATTVIGLVVAALFGALITSLSSSVEHRSLATVDTVLKSFAESVKYAVQLETVGQGTPPGPLFAECATTSSYRVLSTPSPTSGTSNTGVTVFGTGFTPGSYLAVTLGSYTATVTPPVKADLNGNAAVTFVATDPSGNPIPAGSYPVTVTDSSSPAKSATSANNFTVTAGSTLPTVSPLVSYTMAISSIAWWNPTTTPPVWDPSTGVCKTGDQSGIQRLTLTATAADHTTDTLQMIIGDPDTIGPVVTSANSTTFTAGTSGTNFTVTTTGFPEPALSDAGFTDATTGTTCTPSTLPTGVSFNDNHDGTATITNNPAAGTGGSYTICITASSSSGTGYQKFTLTVDQQPAIAVPSPPSTTFSTGTPSTYTFTSTGFPYPAFTDASFSGCSASPLPSGVTFVDKQNGTATLGGTPAAGTGGLYTVCVNASNGVGSPSTLAFTLTVNQQPAITSPPNTTFTVGAAGSFTVTATGYPPPTFTMSGTLPSGVTFNAATGVLSGRPAAGTGQTYTVTFKATNAAGSASQPFTLVVNQAPAITSANSATFSTGTSSSFTITTTGFPTPALSDANFNGCTVSTLPSGVTVQDNGNGTATLAGTPASGTGGAYTLCINASNGVAPSATQRFTLTVDQKPAITSAGSTTFTVGTAGTFTVTASGFPAPTLTESGALPSGVTFNTATGVLSGTPAAGTGNAYTLTFQATSTSGTATQTFTLTVNEAPTITSANNTIFPTGTTSSFTVTATGYPKLAFTNASFTGCTASTLPSGVTFTDNGNGTATLTGTPAAGTGGTYTVCLNATNVAGSFNQTFTLTVYQAPVITSAGSSTFSAGTGGSFTVTATGFPAPALSETGNLPSGVTFNPATGVLSGTPAPGSGNTYNITFKATSAAGTATQSFTLIVQEAPGITSASITSFAVGAFGSFTVTSSGFPAPTITNANFTGCATSALPTGVSFSNNGNGTATLSGTPAAGTGGAYTLCLNSSNGIGSPDTQKFTLTVTQAAGITSANTTKFYEGLPGTFTVTTTGYPAPAISNANFTGCTASTLPAGVTFNDNGNGTATLTGTATTGSHGAYTLCLNATNPSGPATQTFTLTVVQQQPPAINGPTSTIFTVSAPNSLTITTSGQPPPALSLANSTGCTGSAPPGGVGFTDNGNGTATLAGTPAAGTVGTYTLCINASNGAGSPAQESFTLTVGQPPSFTSASSATYLRNTPISFNVTASGFPAPTFSTTSTLPGTLTLSPSGLLSGNSGNQKNTYTIIITASNGATPNVTQTFTLTVN
jgi:hypothetical protein